jgi:hypothetical protein
MQLQCNQSVRFNSTNSSATVVVIHSKCVRWIDALISTFCTSNSTDQLTSPLHQVIQQILRNNYAPSVMPHLIKQATFLLFTSLQPPTPSVLCEVRNCTSAQYFNYTALLTQMQAALATQLRCCCSCCARCAVYQHTHSAPFQCSTATTSNSSISSYAHQFSCSSLLLLLCSTVVLMLRHCVQQQHCYCYQLQLPLLPVSVSSSSCSSSSSSVSQ